MLDAVGLDANELFAPDKLPSAIKLMALVSLFSLVPMLLMLTTCFVRIVVVLGLLRQGLGTQQILPNQVITGLSVFLTATVMWPVWQAAYQQGIRPYADAEYPDAVTRQAAFDDAVRESLRPLRRFMSLQIESTGNEAAIDLFLEYDQRFSQETSESVPRYYEDVPLQVLLPAYVLSELKTAFLIGFQVYLPFLVIDLIVSSLLAGTGLVSTPPAVVALPCKLLVFVLADGWFLTVEMLLNSVGAVS